MAEFAGKVAVVSGAASGISRVIAGRFAAGGGGDFGGGRAGDLLPDRCAGWWAGECRRGCRVGAVRAGRYSGP
jgi:NAD(P)-dependent dehydrogenase (short-subunit alcohol dehydrogenase family)